jgi:hypothetical protein
LKFFLINHIDDLKNEFKDYIAKKLKWYNNI